MVKSTRITLAEDFQGRLNSDARVPRQFLKESLWLKHDIIRGRATGKLLKIQKITSHPATRKQSQLNAMSYLKKKNRCGSSRELCWEEENFWREWEEIREGNQG